MTQFRSTDASAPALRPGLGRTKGENKRNTFYCTTQAIDRRFFDPSIKRAHRRVR